MNNLMNRIKPTVAYNAKYNRKSAAIFAFAMVFAGYGVRQFVNAND